MMKKKIEITVNQNGTITIISDNYEITLKNVTVELLSLMILKGI